MKGMTTTLVLNEPDDQPHETLESILRQACTKYGIPDGKREQIVKNGLGLFEYDHAHDFVFPLGGYQTVYEYLLDHHDEPDIVHNGAINELTKDQLYDRLVKAARVGRFLWCTMSLKRVWLTGLRILLPGYCLYPGP